jgi:hypothetical protein
MVKFSVEFKVSLDVFNVVLGIDIVVVAYHFHVVSTELREVASIYLRLELVVEFIIC